MAARIMRAIWSDAPPAPAATTISIDLFGSHASAWPLGIIASARAATDRHFVAVFNMVSLPDRF